MSTTKERVTPATQGMRFDRRTSHGGTSAVETYTVGPKCEANSGRWVCVTHPDEDLPNQIQKDFHIGRGKHVLAWWCFHHGPEVP